MKPTTRSKMVAGAADLIRRRGLNATSVREVVRYTETPRGSISHHFPQGKLQLVTEALAYAGEEVRLPLQKLLDEKGALMGLRAFIGMWRQVLVSTDCQAGCPVLAVAVEQYVGEDGNLNPAVQEQLLEQTHEIFQSWQNSIAAAIARESVPTERARRLATLVVSSVEGTVALCRAAHSVKALDEVAVELEALLEAAIRSQPRQVR